jgi:hypothetical protein
MARLLRLASAHFYAPIDPRGYSRSVFFFGAG